ncbi:ABC transporter permease [Hazenella sp. IB182353]|uniref:ABC transporter permease n=1 Tax=Polycladospora coralii TaxID=2771432 RepID=UPI0017466F6B|nr:ABC transporter permease [Polycladospora coralii]MBS7530599.1 ABC transporter permease [Polycladospora coralii]
MIANLMWSDFMKLRRSYGIYYFLFSLVVGLGLFFYLHIDYSLNNGYDLTQSWGIAFDSYYSYLLKLFVLFSITFIASMFINMDHHSNMWKLIFTTPINRWKYYVTRIIWVVILAQVLGLLSFTTIYLIGTYYDVHADISATFIFHYIWYPFLLAIPVIALQVILSMLFSNQSIALLIGISGIYLSAIFVEWGKVIPWGYWQGYLPPQPTIEMLHNSKLSYFAPTGWGILSLMLVIVLGIVALNRKDFN